MLYRRQRQFMRPIILLITSALLWPLHTHAQTPTPLASAAPRNVILMIGDGMGFEGVKAASLFSQGSEKTLGFQSLPHQAEVVTEPLAGAFIDSAAAGTAMATGQKVNNGVVSVALPGDGGDLPTVLEQFRDQCKKTGLVTTTEITHATPAVFGAHTKNRENNAEIARDYMTQTKPNVLLGGGHEDFPTALAAQTGYTVVTNRDGLSGLDPHSSNYILGSFGVGGMAYEHDFIVGRSDFYETLPHLSEMTSAALNILGTGESGFFLMVEGGRIDHAEHGKNIERTVFETLEFSKSVDIVLQWMVTHPDTLLVVTSDHETGGITVVSSRGTGEMPEVTWATSDHTQVPVPAYATGKNAELVTGTLDNADIYRILTHGMSAASSACEGAATTTPLSQRTLIYIGLGATIVCILSLFIFLVRRAFGSRNYPMPLP
jgi:alkaline phosphatase